jgi:hypothetical protein
MFPKLPNFGRNYNLAVLLPWVILEVFLVVVLGLVEGFQRFDLRNDRRIPNPGRRDSLDHMFGDHPLFAIMVENDGTVLSAHVSPLPV